MFKINVNCGYYIKHRSDNQQTWLKHPFLVIAADDFGFLALEFSDATTHHPYNGLPQWVDYFSPTHNFENLTIEMPYTPIPIKPEIFKLENAHLFSPFFTKQSSCDTTKLYYFSLNGRLEVSREYDFSHTILIWDLTRKVIKNIQKKNFKIYNGNLERVNRKTKNQTEKLIQQLNTKNKIWRLFFN